MSKKLCRSCLLAVTALVGVFLAPAPARAAVRLVPVTNASNPVYLTHARDQRLFIVELGGRIRIFDRTAGVLRPTPFLDLSAKVLINGGESGLLSMAFHPDYASNGFFYVDYVNLQGNIVVERYKVGANPDLADPASAARLLLITHPFSEHYGGQLQMGPHDGHLYVSVGDGGASDDPQCRAQNKTSLHGKILRLDIRANLNQAPFHGIPADNPFIGAGDPGNQIADEIWALGLRNPWRFSLDRLTGDLYIGDVGESALEEVDLRRAAAGGGANFGWSPMEGTQCHGAGDCPAGTPACGSAAFTPPIFQVSHAEDCAITGGYFYRGRSAPELAGRYLFGDFCSGEVRTLREVSAGNWQSQPLLRAGFGGLSSFGEDADGDLYALAEGTVFRFVSDPASVPATGAGGGMLLAIGLALSGAALLRGFGRPAKTGSPPG